MKIIEPTNTESKEVTISLNIPYNIYLHGKRPADEYSEISIESLQNETETLFSHIELISFQLDNGEIPKVTAVDIIGTLARLGSGLSRAADQVRLGKKRRQNYEEKSERFINDILQNVVPESDFTKPNLQKVREDYLNKLNRAKELVRSLIECLDYNGKAIITLSRLCALFNHEQRTEIGDFADEVSGFIFSLTDEIDPSVKTDDVLDFSQMTAEQLGTTDAAKCIFDFIHQPNIPSKVYEAFYDLFGNLLKSLPADYQNKISVSEQSPDYIAEVLKGSVANGGVTQ
jgi:hypothetical protein